MNERPFQLTLKHNIFLIFVLAISTGSFGQESCELNKLKVNELKKHRTLSEVILSYAKQNRTTFMQVH